MSGHRQGTGKPRRSDRRIAEHKRRVAAAPEPKRRVSAAFDRYRSAAFRCGNADAELDAVAGWLNDRAKALEAAA